MATNGDLPQIIREIVNEMAEAGGHDNALWAWRLSEALMNADPDPCFLKAAPDEPIFVLRSSLRTAAALVRVWADNNKQIGPDRMAEALALADAMDAWGYHKAAD